MLLEPVLLSLKRKLKKKKTGSGTRNHAPSQITAAGRTEVMDGSLVAKHNDVRMNPLQTTAQAIYSPSAV